MKAVFFRRHGGNEVLEYGDWPDPRPAAGEVVVGIRAAALNHLDIFVRDGVPGVPLPQVPGADGAVVVEEIGCGVTGFTPGDRVLIQPGLFDAVCEYCRAGEHPLCVRFGIVGEHAPGTCAEKVAIPARNLFPIPEKMTFEQAAAFPLVYQTAWRMIVGKGETRTGDLVLIHGVGGGVAWAALEIATLCGARVLATTSSEAKAAEARGARAEPAGGEPADLLEAQLDPGLHDGERPGVPRAPGDGRLRPAQAAHRPRPAAVPRRRRLPAAGGRTSLRKNRARPGRAEARLARRRLTCVHPSPSSRCWRRGASRPEASSRCTSSRAGSPRSATGSPWSPARAERSRSAAARRGSRSSRCRSATNSTWEARAAWPV